MTSYVTSSLLNMLEMMEKSARRLGMLKTRKRQARRRGSTPRVLWLEILEDRDVPSTFMLDSALVAWNNDWGNFKNWTDVTTGQPATRAPGAYDDVLIGAKSELLVNVLNPADCRSVNVDPYWNGRIDLSGASLTVWGVNGANSNMWSGVIVTSSADGNLIINGGTFNYDTIYLNVWLVDPGKLDVYVNQSATFDVGSDCQALHGSFYIGTTPTGTLSYGTVDFSAGNPVQPCTFFPTDSVNLSSAGSVFFTPFSYTAGLTLSDNGGSVYLANGAYAASSPINAISISNGGMMECLGAGGSATVRGTLSFDDASTLLMPGVDSFGNGGYFTLKADSVAMGRSSNFSFHVNATTNGLCDTIFASSFSTDGTARSICYTDGTPGTGSYDYEPIVTFANSFSGQFGFYVWDGWFGNGYTWTPSYPGAGAYHLSGTVMNPTPVPGPIPGPAPAPLPPPPMMVPLV